MAFLPIFNKQKFFLLEKGIFAKFAGVLSRKGFLLNGLKKLIFSLSILKRETGVSPSKFLEEFIEDFRPQAGIRFKKVAGIQMKIPVILKEGKSIAIFLHWFLQASAPEIGAGSEIRLANELVLSSNSEGIVLQKLKELYSDVLSNEPNLRFLRKKRRFRRRLRRKYYKRKFFYRYRRTIFRR